MRVLHTPAHGLGAGVAAAVLLGLLGLAEAADHRDTAVLSAEAGYDIADLFVWRDVGQPPPSAEHDAGVDADGGGIDGGPLPLEPYLFMAMTLRGRPVPGAQYVFHLEARSDLTGSGNQGYAVCTFDQTLALQCWVRDMLYVEGHASEGVEHDGLMAWAGFANDPSFGNVGAVRELIGGLVATQTSSRSRGCSDITEQTRQDLLQAYAATPDNAFAQQEAFVILLRMKPEVAAPGGPLLGVSASVRIN